MFIAITPSLVNAGEYTDEQCLEVVLAVEKAPKEINKDNVKIFLDTLISKTCRGNVEYAEWSNEVLHNIMGKTPSLTFKSIRLSPKKVKNQVIDELEHPIHDGINYPAIYKSINSIKDKKTREFAIKMFLPYYNKHMEYVKDWEKRNNLKWKYGR